MTNSVLLRRFHAVIAIVALFALQAVSQNTDARVTVHAGANQTFKGLGVSQLIDWGGLPQSKRTEIATLLWKDCDMRVLRMWAFTNRSGSQMVSIFRNHINDIKAVQPNLILLLAPSGAPANQSDAALRSYAAHFAQVMADMKSAGIHVDVTGIANEPDNKPAFPYYKMPTAIKMFREEMDNRGLDDVKIICPENANVDIGMLRITDSIAADEDALAALDGFACHAYNMSMLKEWRDQISPFGKELWQTESSQNDPECQGDERRAVIQAMRLCADVNLGVEYWIHFIGYHPDGGVNGCGVDAATKIIIYDGSGNYRIQLKYYYYKQFVQAIPVGTVLRTATSDLGWLADDASNWWNNLSFEIHGDKCIRMENTYGNKPPITCAAGIAPDDSWNIALANSSGCMRDTLWRVSPPVAVGYYLKERTFDVTVHIEEMKDVPSATFTVYRSNKDVQISNEGAVTMVNGDVTVTLEPFDFVTLRGVPGSSCVPPSISQDPSGNAATEGEQVTLSTVASGTSLSFQWQSGDGTTWADIAMATSPDYVFTAQQSHNNMQFRCIVTGNCGTPDTSAAATLTVGLVAPSNLQYAENPARYVVGRTITNNTPTVTGTVDSYAVTPALPGGLALNATSGVISGTPAAITAAADYTVTATNTEGNTTVAVNITVLPDIDSIPPTNTATLTLTAVSATEIDIRWTTPESDHDDADSVYVLYSTSSALNPATALLAAALKASTAAGERNVAVTGLAQQTKYYVALLVVDTASNISPMVADSVVTPLLDEPINPLVVRGSRVDSNRVAIVISNYGNINTTAPAGTYYADSAGVWYQSGWYPTSPDDGTVRRYSVASLKAAGASYADTFTVDVLSPGGDSSYYICVSVFWKNTVEGDTIPPFVRDNSADVFMFDTVGLPIPFTVSSSSYNSADTTLSITLAGTGNIDASATQMGVWHGFAPTPDFDDASFVTWVDAAAARAADQYVHTIKNPLFASDTQQVYFALTLKNAYGTPSQPLLDSATVGTPRPVKTIALNAGVIGPQWAVLYWSEADSVRIWYGTDTIPLSYDIPDSFFVLNPAGTETTITVNTLNPSTQYWFGLQAFDNGLWSTVTPQSRLTLTTLALTRTDTVPNRLTLDAARYDSTTNRISLFVSFDAKSGNWRDSLQVGIAYSLGGYPYQDDNLQVFDLLAPDTIVTMRLREQMVFDTTYYISLLLRQLGSHWALPTERSRGTVRTTGFTRDRVTYFASADTMVSAFNGTVLLRRDQAFGTAISDTLRIVAPPSPLPAGMAAAGVGFTFTQKTPSPAFYVGIRHNPLPAGIDTSDLCMYRIDSLGNLYAEHESYLENGVVWARISDVANSFVVLSDTVSPLASAAFVSDTTQTYLYEVRKSITDTIVVTDPVANVAWTLLVSKNGAGGELVSARSGTCTKVGDTIVTEVSYRDVKVTTGMMAFLVLSDGVNADTVNLSRQVYRAGSDPVTLTAGLKWHPVWATAELTSPQPANALSGLADNTANWYSHTSFRLMQWINGAWTEYTAAGDAQFQFEPGRLMWVCVAGTKGFNLGEGKTVSYRTPFAFTIPPLSWLDFGLPFKFGVRLSDILAASGAGATSLRFYRWSDAAVYTATAVHIPGTAGLDNPAAVLDSSILHGYTVYNPTANAVTLSIPPLPVAMAPQAKVLAKRNWGDAWTIRMHAAGNDGLPATSALCSYVPSHDSRSHYPSPPSHSPLLVSVLDETGAAHGQAVSGDMSEGGLSFMLRISNASEKPHTVKLNPEYLHAPPENIEARLLNPETGDWDTRESVSLAVGAGGVQYRVLAVGTEAFLERFRSEFSPLKAALSGVFPNPFSRATTIRYTLPYTDIKACRFMLYDLSGRRVWFHNVRRPRPGHAAVTWNGTANGTHVAASGVYILRMRVEYNGQRRPLVFKQRLTRLR